MRRVFDLAAAVLMSMILIVGVFTVGPMLETRYFPVYSKFTLDHIAPQPNGRTIIYSTFTKYRDCVPIGFAWYVGDGINVRQLQVIVLRADHEAPTPVRPVGTQRMSPFEVDASPEEIASLAFAEVYTRCHPLWTTRSEVFP